MEMEETYNNDYKKWRYYDKTAEHIYEIAEHLNAMRDDMVEYKEFGEDGIRKLDASIEIIKNTIDNVFWK